MRNEIENLEFIHEVNRNEINNQEQEILVLKKKNADLDADNDRIIRESDSQDSAIDAYEFALKFCNEENKFLRGLIVRQNSIKKKTYHKETHKKSCCKNLQGKGNK